LFRRTKGGIVVSTKKSNGKSCPEMLAVLEFQAQFGDERQCGEKLSRQQWAGGLRLPALRWSELGFYGDASGA